MKNNNNNDNTNTMINENTSRYCNISNPQKNIVICRNKRSYSFENWTENLYILFQKTNANVILKCNQWSHNLIQEDVLIARRWISNNFSVYV